MLYGLFVNFTRKARDHRLKKIVAFLVADTLIVFCSLLLAFLLRFDGIIPSRYLPYLPLYIGLSLLFTLPLLYWRRLYLFTWAFVSLDEIVEIAYVVAASGFLFALTYLLFQAEPAFRGFPRSVIIIHHALVFLFVSLLRSAKRVALLLFEDRGRLRKNTLVIGADEGADELIRNLQRANLKQKQGGYALIGILDDRPQKQGTLLHGVDVLGPIESLVEVAKKYDIQSIIIALSQDEHHTIPRIIALAKTAGIQDIKIVPTIYEVLTGKPDISHIRPVRVEDLLGRKPAKIETGAIDVFLKHKRILITGAAGSIGSELCHQIAKFSPRALQVLDYEESNLFDLARLLAIEHPNVPIKIFVADVRNKEKIEDLILSLKPDVIFHAAAYKHVPLMEEFPEEAVSTNVFGTLFVAQAALKARVKKFVLISTDKAVRPRSMMGKTKKLAEMLVSSLNAKGGTHFVSVRFGNVLGSRGSVLPIFEEQIRRRLPIKVTHPKMTRYFMTTPEAALLVLEAASLGEGGEIFVLDMGKPVKIVDFAKQVIRLYGLEPDRDIPILYTKPRPGEKIEEELLHSEEELTATQYQKVFRTKTLYHSSFDHLYPKILKLKTHFSDKHRLRQETSKLVDL